jgi:hypothetical protein
MFDLVVWSFLASLLPIVLHVCVRILSVAAGAFVCHDEQPVVLNHHPHLTFHILSPASWRSENFKHGH